MGIIYAIYSEVIQKREWESKGDKMLKIDKSENRIFKSSQYYFIFFCMSEIILK